MSNDIRATFHTLCGCTRQIWLPLQEGGPPEYHQLALHAPVEVKVDAEPTMELHSRTFKLTTARRNSWGFIDADYVEVKA